MRLPILSDYDDPSHPSDGTCLQCGMVLDSPKNGFVCLSAAAALTDDTGSSVFVEHAHEIDLKIIHHGPHKDIDERYAVAPRARRLWGAQFQIYFCSTACLRKLLNEWVDTLEAMP